MDKSDEDWKKQLTPEQYAVLRCSKTEAPFSGELFKNEETGDYICVACHTKLFDSETKFDSGSGWPSFYDVADTEAVTLRADTSLAEPRVEIRCATCGGHLGHVFHDAPDQPTGVRFCVNSAALQFKKKGGA